MRYVPVHSDNRGWHRLANRMALAALVLAMLPASFGMGPRVALAVSNDIIGPAGSGEFGRSVTVLPNGNIVVTDPLYDDGATVNVGAVYLYNGATRALISAVYARSDQQDHHRQCAGRPVGRAG